jgi:hypothetical protein
MRKPHPTKIYSGQFLGRALDMLKSPAFRALGLTDLRVLARIEIEHMTHKGVANGRLPVTYSDLVEYGVKRKLVNRSLRRLTALGFIEITHKGRAGNREYRNPSLLRLTYATTFDGKRHVPATDEWRKFTTAEQVASALANAEKGAGHEEKRRRCPPRADRDDDREGILGSRKLDGRRGARQPVVPSPKTAATNGKRRQHQKQNSRPT